MSQYEKRKDYMREYKREHIKRLYIEIPLHEAQAWYEAAEHCGLPVSTFIKRTMRREIGKIRADLDQKYAYFSWYDLALSNGDEDLADQILNVARAAAESGEDPNKAVLDLMLGIRERSKRSAE